MTALQSKPYAETQLLTIKSNLFSMNRTRMNEVSLVLKSVTILISALKEAQLNPTAKGTVNRTTVFYNSSISKCV